MNKYVIIVLFKIKVMYKNLTIILLLFCATLFGQQAGNNYPFQNTSLSFEERVNDLVSRMTLDEKISQMMNASPAVKRLGVLSYNWWNECLHGVARSGINVTVFPQAIGLAATFDDEALYTTASYTSDEARAIYNDAIRKNGAASQYHGLTFWTPNINIFRDPRWGRGQETYGEDPYLTARMGTAMVTGLQGNDAKYLKVSACAKHFAVHSGPENLRHVFNVAVNNYDLWDTYLPAFKALVTQAKVSSVMCAYNSLYGQPCCGNDLLLDSILRKDWKFTGYMTSDCGAINDFFEHHKTHPDAASAAADAVLHGTDLECGDVYHALKTSVEKGLITEKDIDVSVKRLFMIRFRLGMFDDVDKQPYTKLSMNELESKEHRDMAEKMARESIVLLKNNGILPLSKNIKRIAVLGPNADNKETLLGNYNGFSSYTITPLQSILSEFKGDVVYAKGTDYVKYDSVKEQEALQAARSADVVIFVGGISPTLEGEQGLNYGESIEGFSGGDRTAIELPAVQTALMKKIKELGVPLIFVSMSGSALGFEWEAEHTDAILQTWYGGQAAGTAITDVLFGKYNPAGRLPVTFYRRTSDLPDMTDYSMSNRTYRYFKKPVLYPFGYGLSYTNFAYKIKNSAASVYTIKDTIHVSCLIANTGEVDGDEVAQVYIQYPSAAGLLPLKELKQFTRIHLQKGESRMANFSIPVTSLLKWNDKENKQDLFKGKYTLFIGSNSNDKKLINVFTVH